MKRMISVLLSLCLGIGVFPLAVCAEGELEIIGPALIQKPMHDITAAVSFSVLMEDVQWHLAESYAGLWMKQDGTLLLSDEAEAGEVVIEAAGKNETVRKALQIVEGIHESFEADSVNERPGNACWITDGASYGLSLIHI